ncbi:MAG: 3-deoxy-7-phosphoheptulonate synthase [Clostridia bacterium]
MIVVINNKNSNTKQLDNLKSWIKGLGLDIDVSEGTTHTVLGLIGDTSKVDIDLLRSLDIVDSVKRIQEPYKKANRKFHPEDTIINVNGYNIGGNNFTMIAGPCSIESEHQIVSIAKELQSFGTHFLRGGAFKPRTSPYAFQGLREGGLTLLLKAKEATGMGIVTEIMSAEHIDLMKDVDILQVGARNMQNFELLKALGRTNKPILLKRGLCATINEWLMSAEYIMAEGNNQVILCERGIRTFETYTRNTLDLSAIPIVKELTHLPVIVDPSHASGLSRLVRPMSLAAAGAGSDGLMIEVHNDPCNALCDGAQALLPGQYNNINKEIDIMLPMLNKVRN